MTTLYFCIVGYAVLTMVLVYVGVWRHRDGGYTGVDKWGSILLSPLFLPICVLGAVYEHISRRMFPIPRTEILVAVPETIAEKYTSSVKHLVQGFAEEVSGLTVYEDDDCHCVRFTLPRPEQDVRDALRQVLPAEFQAMIQVNKMPLSASDSVKLDPRGVSTEASDPNRGRQA